MATSVPSASVERLALARVADECRAQARILSALREHDGGDVHAVSFLERMAALLAETVGPISDPPPSRAALRVVE